MLYKAVCPAISCFSNAVLATSNGCSVVVAAQFPAMACSQPATELDVNVRVMLLP
jgi:hypothetical protein